MFERFTADARETVAGAQREARQLKHWVGTEHLLLACRPGPAARRPPSSPVTD